MLTRLGRSRRYADAVCPHCLHRRTPFLFWELVAVGHVAPTIPALMGDRRFQFLFGGTMDDLQISWQRIGSGKLRTNMVDSTSIIVKPSGQWELTFPNGQSVGGQCKTETQAKVAWVPEYHRWIIDRWQHGGMNWKGDYVVPLS